MNIAELIKRVANKINQLLDDIANHPITDAIASSSRKISSAIKSAWRALCYSPQTKTVLHGIRGLFVFLDKSITTLVNVPIQQLKSSSLFLIHFLSSKFKQTKASILKTKAWQYALLVRFDKPIGTLLLLWPTLIALWIAAEGIPDTDVLLVFVLGVFLMRSAGCAINDYADRNIDAKVERTKNRPLATGKITGEEALIVFMILSFSAFFLILFMNKLTIFLSVGGVLLAASYPFMKRYHYLPQIHLGAAFGWSVPMAYAAQANELTQVTWLLFFATILWATAYHTMYAMVDRDDDIKIGVKSTAILFGNADRLIIGFIQIALILNLIVIGEQLKLSGFYYLGIVIASGFAVYQQYLIKDRDKALCFSAFLNNHWLGLALFAGVFLEYQIGALS